MEQSLSYQSYKQSPYRSIKHSTYFDVYDKLFAQYRGKPITFVEIGVLGGGSLFMWRDFFGPEARIIGVDLNPNAKKWEEDGFEIFIGSQSNAAFWQDFARTIGPVDIILDDGGHTYEQQIITTENLLDSVKDGGMLVVEDTHTSYMPGYGPRSHSFMEYVKTYVDKINHRFRDLDHARSDSRIWSVQVYESIVAFHVDRQCSKLPSAPTDNGGKSDFAECFRDFDSQDQKPFDNLASRFAFIKHIPGVKLVGQSVRDYLVDRKITARIGRYFR